VFTVTQCGDLFEVHVSSSLSMRFRLLNSHVSYLFAFDRLQSREKGKIEIKERQVYKRQKRGWQRGTLSAALRLVVVVLVVVVLFSEQTFLIRMLLLFLIGDRRTNLYSKLTYDFNCF